MMMLNPQNSRRVARPLHTKVLRNANRKLWLKAFWRSARRMKWQVGHNSGSLPLVTVSTDLQRGQRGAVPGAGDLRLVPGAVVGAAAAYLYALLGVGQLYAAVMSERAAAILAEHGILFEADTLVPLIKNRTGDGFCPMESAVWHLPLRDTQGALAAIEATMARLIAKK